MMAKLYAPSPYGSTKPPFWDALLSNLRSCPSLSYAVAMTTFRIGQQTVQLTENLLTRYMQHGLEIAGIAYPPGGQDAHAQLKAAQGSLLGEMVAEVVEEPRLIAVIDKMYPSAFPKGHDPIDELMVRDTGESRSVTPEVAEQMMRDWLEARGFTVMGPKDAAKKAAAHVREVYQPLPEMEGESSVDHGHENGGKQ